MMSENMELKGKLNLLEKTISEQKDQIITLGTDIINLKKEQD